MSRKAKAVSCPGCGEPATGNFCQSCGSELGGRFCNQCGAEVGGSARFCNQCGTEVGVADRRAAAAAVVGGTNLPWWIAGAAMFVVILVVGVNMVQPGPGAAPVATPATGAPLAPFAGACSSGGPPPDLSSMTAREAADRLFNRVMEYASIGDSTCAQMFLPMALDGYERARPLDHDGLYHLSLLNRTAMNLEAALANAQEVLAGDPNHLLALAAAGEAAAELGRSAEAETLFRRVLDVYDSERTRGLAEYLDHAPIVERVDSVAEAFLAGR